MKRRSFLRQSVRIVVLVIGLLLPQVVPTSVPIAVILLAVVVAYEGADRTLVASLLTALLLLEIMWGLEIGLRSAAFAVAVLVFILAERWFTFVPWAREDGWRIRDAARTLIAVVLLASVMTVSTALLFSVVYGHGLVGARLVMALDANFFQSVLLFGTLFLVLFRRIDEPIRRSTSFPT